MTEEPLEHVGLTWQIREGCVEEYDRRHATMWPELESRLRELGLVACTIFRQGRECYGHFQVRGGWARHLAAYDADPIGRRWEEEFGELIEFEPEPDTGGPKRLTYVWSLGDRAP